LFVEKGNFMHVRSVLAAVLAIAPLAAPAQAESNDCDTFQSAIAILKDELTGMQDVAQDLQDTAESGDTSRAVSQTKRLNPFLQEIVSNAGKDANRFEDSAYRRSALNIREHAARTLDADQRLLQSPSDSTFATWRDAYLALMDNVNIYIDLGREPCGL
jgi:septal ring factor EnvC (AmiA/AmiB activator)